jgi:hypothetical protein
MMGYNGEEMVSTEEVFDALGISESEALEHLNKYTFGSNELTGAVSIVRYAAWFAFELRKNNEAKDEL